MKRIGLICISIIMMTGCGMKSNDTFTNTCTEETHSEGFQYQKSYEMTYKDDIISKIVIEYHYTASNQTGISTLKAVKTSFLNDTNKYQSIEGFTLEIEIDNDQEYLAKYLLDFTTMHKADIEKFGLTTDYIKQIRMFKDQNKTCK